MDAGLDTVVAVNVMKSGFYNVFLKVRATEFAH